MTWLHRFAKLVAGCTFLLVTAGGLVTSTGSGLSVPDWPTTYGSSMFTFPVSRWVGGILYEHGHRLIASLVGILTILLAVWTWRRDDRLWVKALGFVALAAVVTQGVLGGITVLLLLPPPVSVGHAGIAQIFFALTVTLALVTSPGWRRGYEVPSQESIVADVGLRRLAVVTTTVVYIQILLGATMRHTGAGLAIPDFPLAFGQLVPFGHFGEPGVALHFTHRLVALLTAGLIFATVWRVWRLHRNASHLVNPAVLAAALVVLQITLGAWTVLSGRNVFLNTAHVATGALTFVTTVVLLLRAHRPLIDEIPAGVVAAARGARG